jgi:hypothetical protein
MAPKTPQELREQIEKQNEQPAQEGNERTAEGVEVPTPSRDDFFSHLREVSKPEKKQ